MRLSKPEQGVKRGNRVGVGVLAVFGLACLLLAGCGQWSLKGTPPPPAPSDNWLSEELRSIPADYGSTFLRFANLRAAKEAFGAADFKGIESLSEGEAPPESIFKVLGWEMPGNLYVSGIYEDTGIDLWGFDSILWAGKSTIQAESPHITVIRGGFGDDIGTRLKRLEYESDSCRGVTWYYAWSGSGPAFRKLRDSPFSTDAAKLNAIAPVGERLLIRRWTGSIQSQIEIHQGAQPSLSGEDPYRELAQAMGSELLGGAFVSPSNVQNVWSTFEYSLSPERLPGFAPESESWGTLDEYTLAIVGYGVRDGKEATTFALHYANPDGAASNAAELELRLRTAQVYLYNRSTNVPQHSDESFHYPLTGNCERLGV